MKVSAAVVLAAALFGGSDEDVVSRLHVRFDERDLIVRSCLNVVGSGNEAGLATIRYRYRTENSRVLANGSYVGSIVFELGDIVVNAPRSIGWPQMSEGDRARSEALRRAIVHHEIGHVRVAETVRDALNARTTTIVEPDAGAFRAEIEAQGQAGFESFMREERAYDALTDHGRRQHVAPGPLAGADTVLQCS
ncbi:MAG TPA: DUF922 domain-containing protein [Candidatus Elarobacter sp.]|jgi:hypothetical protein|nr:DUF922 domain-containing protein [Candidatus Elarobacter sp.]